MPVAPAAEPPQIIRNIQVEQTGGLGSLSSKNPKSITDFLNQITGKINNQPSSLHKFCRDIPPACSKPLDFQAQDIKKH